jgi:hypothetical protein
MVRRLESDRLVRRRRGREVERGVYERVGATRRWGRARARNEDGGRGENERGPRHRRGPAMRGPTQPNGRRSVGGTLSEARTCGVRRDGVRDGVIVAYGRR